MNSKKVIFCLIFLGIVLIVVGFVFNNKSKNNVSIPTVVEEELTECDPNPLSSDYEYKVGDAIITKDGSKWHVLKGSTYEDTTVTLLSDYNLNSDGTYNTSCGKDINNIDSCHDGKLAFDLDNTNVYNEEDSNNIGYFIKNTYAPLVVKALPGTTNVTLPMASVLACVDGNQYKDWVKVSAEWLLTTKYITKTPLKDSSTHVYYVYPGYGVMITENAKYSVGVRPVITTPKTNILGN